MSLINDALKRARHAQQKDRGAAREGAPMEPAEPAASGRFSADAKLRLLSGLVLFLCALSVWLLWRGFSNGQASASGSRPKAFQQGPESATAGHAAAMEMPLPEAAPPAVRKKAPVEPAPAPEVAAHVPIPAAQTPVTQEVVTAQRAVVPQPKTAAPLARPAAAEEKTAPTASVPETNSPPTTAVVSNPPFAKVHLQAVFYYRNSPSSALINGRVCYAGDEVGGVHVVRVARQSVTLEAGGRREILHIH